MSEAAAELAAQRLERERIARRKAEKKAPVESGAKLSGKAADLLAAVRAVEGGGKAPSAVFGEPSREPVPGPRAASVERDGSAGVGGAGRSAEEGASYGAAGAGDSVGGGGSVSGAGSGAGVVGAAGRAGALGGAVGGTGTLAGAPVGPGVLGPVGAAAGPTPESVEDARGVLVEGGAPEALAGQVAGALGEGAGAVLREDPWQLLRVAGVRPEQADGFARALLGAECGPDDERRGRAVTGWLLEQAALAGHTALELPIAPGAPEQLTFTPAQGGHGGTVSWEPP
ncbi:helix-hairpin-helix domain-containing protein, partial [Streptomyces sp. NPDC047072]|uniref:helix-hairpin-helix domain-containing protein n=1 Tax=Streptomyces sp. NPDC047072 TaxID=3154809 RepID=UPI00340F346D